MVDFFDRLAFCDENNIPELEKSVHEPDFDVNHKEEGMTLLIYAAMHGKIDVVRFLLTLPGIDINSVDDKGCTARDYAELTLNTKIEEAITKKKQFNEEMIAQYLKDFKLNRLYWLLGNKFALIINQIDEVRGTTLLTEACIRKDHSAVEWLIQFDSLNVNLKDEHGYNALHYAVKLADETILTTLSEIKDIDANIEDQDGYGALHYACLQGNLSMVALLLNIKGIDLNLLTPSLETPFDLACINGNIEMVRLFLEQESLKIKAPNKEREHPILGFLFKKLSNINQKVLNDIENILTYKELGKVALLAAIQANKPVIVTILIDRLGHLNNLAAIFADACAIGDNKTIDFLLQKNFFHYEMIDARHEKYGNKRALEIAAENKHIDIIRKVEDKRSINVGLKPQKTFLSRTFSSSSSATSSNPLVFSKTANPSNTSNVSYFFKARESRFPQNIENEKPGNLNQEQDTGFVVTLFAQACSCGDIRIIQSLLQPPYFSKEMITTQHPEYNNKTAVEIAQDKSYDDIVKALKNKPDFSFNANALINTS